MVARCRGQGLSLSADELDLIDAWFAGGTLPQPLATRAPVPPPPTHVPALSGSQPQAAAAAAPSGGGRWWSYDDGRPQQPAEATRAAPAPATQSRSEGEDFPRIVRTRLRS